jgi:prevent-host-death family protein
MNPIISELLPDGAKVLKDIKRRKTPMLITQNGRPAAYLIDFNTYERLEKRMRILEGIARGETAIRQGRSLSHSEAERRMKRWIG